MRAVDVLYCMTEQMSITQARLIDLATRNGELQQVIKNQRAEMDALGAQLADMALAAKKQDE